jgi:Ribonuclease G/E
MLNDDTAEIVTDDENLFVELRKYAEILTPEWSDRIRLHTGVTPLFDLYRVDSQADKAAGRHVWLKSGGSLVIEETEALTVIDVNTGKFTGKKSLGETIFKINCEAAEEIMRQLRLRDIGGIIIIDFIDMEKAAQKQALLDILKEHAKKDRNRTNIGSITPLGLVEVTRKKVRQNMTKQLMHICSGCGGNGYEPSYETTARRIVRDVWKRKRAGEMCPLIIEAIEPVLGWIRTIKMPEGMINMQQSQTSAMEFQVPAAQFSVRIDYEKFLADYVKNSEKPLLCIQMHPGLWDRTDPQSWSEFEKCVDYLMEQGAVFMTPYEYYKYINKEV